MADTRAALLGMGIVLVIVGLFVSNLVCGVGLLFILLGLVIWRREEDDTADYGAKASSGLAGVPDRRRRRRALLVVVVAVVVLVAVLGVYVLYLRSPAPDTFTGVRVSAPIDRCWSGTVGSDASTNGIHVGGCASQDVPLTCTASMWVNLTKSTPGTWALDVTGYRGGTSLGNYSVAGDLGTVRGTFAC